MPKEGDEMNKIKKGYIVLILILLIETIPYAMLKYKIASDHKNAEIRREETTKIMGPPREIYYDDVSDINDRIENFFDVVYPLVVWITLAIANLKIKSKKLKWVIYGMGVFTICIFFYSLNM